MDGYPNMDQPTPNVVHSSKKDIRRITDDELINFLEGIGERKFRSKQIAEWLWKKNVSQIHDMTNLSQETRRHLNEAFELNRLHISEEQKSSDGTVKSAIKLNDGSVIEGVLIPTTKRTTACISSQVGCSLTCKFCATGSLKLKRNLFADEIVDQVVLINKQANEMYGKNLNNIVYMGMGEPLLNYKQVMKSVDIITSPQGLGMSPRRLTISTAGIAKMIQKLGDDQTKVNLALSLHAANDTKRSRIMPINETNTLENLGVALRYFYEKTGTRITLEYIIFDKFNDEIIDASELATFCSQFPCKVNIIEYNPIDNGSLKGASDTKINAFANHLEKMNMVVNVRRSRGKDIDAACGQLANKNKVA